MTPIQGDLMLKLNFLNVNFSKNKVGILKEYWGRKVQICTRAADNRGVKGGGGELTKPKYT